MKDYEQRLSSIEDRLQSIEESMNIIKIRFANSVIDNEKVHRLREKDYHNYCDMAYGLEETFCQRCETIEKRIDDLVSEIEEMKSDDD